MKLFRKIKEGKEIIHFIDHFELKVANSTNEFSNSVTPKWSATCNHVVKVRRVRESTYKM